MNKYIICQSGEDAIDVYGETEEVETRGIKDHRSEIHIPADTYCKTSMEVPVGQIQGADLSPDSVRVWIKCCPKDYVSNSKSCNQKRG